MREHNINLQNNFIGGWYIEDLQLLNDILYFGMNNPKRKAGEVGTANRLIVDRKQKDSVDSHLQDSPELCKRYFALLDKILSLYGQKYPYSVSNKLGLVEVVNVQLYPSNGGYFQYHFERFSPSHPTVTRHLVFMTYLNDVNQAGETEFLYQRTKVKPEKGLTLIWPADWTFTHRGIPSVEEKAIVTGWINLI